MVVVAVVVVVMVVEVAPERKEIKLVTKARILCFLFSLMFSSHEKTDSKKAEQFHFDKKIETF